MRSFGNLNTKTPDVCNRSRKQEMNIWGEVETHTALSGNTVIPKQLGKFLSGRHTPYSGVRRRDHVSRT